MTYLMQPRIVSLLWLPLLLVSIQVAGQNVQFVATASETKIGLNDQIEVTYTLSDAGKLETLGPVNLNKDFIIVGGPYMGQMNSTSTTMGGTGRNTVQSSLITQTWILQPKHTGTLSIPAACAKDSKGSAWHSNSLSLQVVPGSVKNTSAPAQQRLMRPSISDPFDPFLANQQSTPQTGTRQMKPRPAINTTATQSNDLSKEIFLRAVVDKTKAHLGEQVTLYYKLYSRLPIVQADAEADPKLNGFWKQSFDLPRPLPYEYETVNGKTYEVYTIQKMALFPQQSGTLTIDPLLINSVVRLVQEVKTKGGYDLNGNWSGGGAEEDFFGDATNPYVYRDVPVLLKSTPILVEVADVPAASKPAAYTGAVGKFSVSSKLSNATITTDDAATYTLTISGAGNINLFEAPALQLPEGLETTEPSVVDTLNRGSTQVAGSKIITYLLSPKDTGIYTIPELSFTYFNPQSGAYETIKTPAHRLTIKAGKLYAVKDLATAQLPKDIHGNLALLSNAETSPILLSPFYWALYALGLVAAVTSLLSRKRKLAVAILSNKGNNRPETVAMKRLARAQQLMKGSDEKPFFEEINKATWLYLSDRLSIPISQLSKAAAKDALTQSKVPTAVEMKLDLLLQDCEQALYTPSGSTQYMQRTYQSAVTVISEMETFLKA